LEMYRSVQSVYPEFWHDGTATTGMYGADCVAATAPAPDYGPQPFCVIGLDGAGAVVQGYTYIYTNLPAGCTAALGNCTQYTLTAQAQTLGRTGTREFFTDESGVLRHCTGVAGGDVMAEVDENTIDLQPVACD
jgi:hypothetical protein